MTDNKKKADGLIQSNDDFKQSNEATRKAGLIFNINMFKTEMKKCVKKMLGDNKNVMVSLEGGICIAAAIEQLCRTLLTDTSICIKEDLRGVKLLSFDKLVNTINLNEGLKTLYETRLRFYNKVYTYDRMLPIHIKEMAHVLSTVDNTIAFAPRAKTLMYFLLHDAFCEILRVCSELICYSKKSKINGRCILSAIKIVCKNHGLCESLSNEVKRAAIASGYDLSSDNNKDTTENKDDGTVKDDNDDDNNDDDNDDDNNDDDNNNPKEASDDDSEGESEEKNSDDDSDNDKDDNNHDKKSKEKEKETSKPKLVTKVIEVAKVINVDKSNNVDKKNKTKK